jgi:hypothetical protein
MADLGGDVGLIKIGSIFAKKRRLRNCGRPVVLGRPKNLVGGNAAAPGEVSVPWAWQK